MHALTVGLLMVSFLGVAAIFWHLAGPTGLLIWLIFGPGAFSLGRWYQREHVTGLPWGESPPTTAPGA
jgi:hypothetical protein